MADDGQVQLDIDNQPASPQPPRRVLDRYQRCLRSTSGKIREFLVVLDVLSGKDNREEFKDAINDFLNADNILETCYKKLCDLSPSPEEMCRKADELLIMYRYTRNDWKLVVVFIILVMITWGFIASYCGKDLFLSVLAFRGVLCIAEIYRKDKEDAIEKKIKGVAKVGEVASSCCLVQEDLKAFSQAYEDLKANVQHVINQMEARQMKQKMEKMLKDMERAENLVVEAIIDTSFMDADQEILSERNSYNFFHGFMKKLFG